MLENIELIILSFIASLGFGIVFQIKKSYLVYAGLGGLITRVGYIVLMSFISHRIIYAAGAAGIASVYAELLAKKTKNSSTLFLYPAIIPLIPGDLIYYTMGGVVVGNNEVFVQYAGECILALLGISIGFVVCSSAAHYVKKHKLQKTLL